MDISAVHTQAQVSVLKKMMDQQSAAAQKLFAGLDQASAQIASNSASQGAEPGKGMYIDVRA